MSVWSISSEQVLDTLTTAIPSYSYLAAIQVTPVRAHALFPQFADPARQAPAAARHPLYWIDIEIDRARAGPEGFTALYANAAKQVRGATPGGSTGYGSGIWAKASGNGAYAVWEYPDPESLSRALAAMPLLPTMRWLRATPILPHPALPQLAGWTRTAQGAPA